MTAEQIRVLIIDDEKFHAEALAESLGRVGYECVLAASGAAGLEKMEEEEFGVVITDLKMEDMDGLAVVRKVKQISPETVVVVITGHADTKTAVEAIKEGAVNYLVKPVDMAELRAIVERAAEHIRLARTNRELKQQLDEKFGFEGMIGISTKMREVMARLRDLAPTDVTVLIQGETGTGKELIAKAIHNNSPRKNKPFVAMNCTALNENLLDDELFGHEPGSFTGGDRLRKGRFEHANGGTIFLDEVGDMPLSLQAKLLRVLENREVVRIGSNESIKVNVRVLSATNRDLESAVAAGTFRQDLYYRLKVITVRLAPLRERREDIPLLCNQFIREFNQHYRKHVTGVAEPVRKLMNAYDWPGNVRELRNNVESMVVQDHDGILGLDDMQEGDTLRRVQLPDLHASSPSSLIGRPLLEVERYYVQQALEKTGGNREEAARMLGIGERTLYRMIQDWKLQDKIAAAVKEAGGNLAQAALALGMKQMALERKMKKWGMPILAEQSPLA
ncbi:MAG TPA: sigma 54-interacting transcriptional regulator [Gemmataceae bacterium]|nr:sigma 54-interacting transcriptional regulator [Gemmataceae bacterium]